MATYLQYGDEVVLTVPASAYKDKHIHVLTLSFDKKIEPFPGKTIRNAVLTPRNATPQYSYSCFDYYTNYRSITGYSWNFEQLLLKQLEIIYTSQEAGREIDLILDGKTYTVTLDKGKEIKETAFQVLPGEKPTYVVPAAECSIQQRNWMQTYSMHLYPVKPGPKRIKTVTRLPARFYPAIM